MAGNRVGYVAGPAAAIAEALKLSTHTVYAAPTAAQLAALRILEGAGDAWIARTRDAYRSLGEAVADRLGLPRPEGSTFLFLDVASRLDDRGLTGLLEDAADRGLLLSPGPSFGPCPTHARVCYTSAPPDVVLRGVEILASLLGR
jgi:aspartate/methionine/tyrosine aminotransferase